MAIPIQYHGIHHFLQPLVASDATDNQNVAVALARMSQGSFGNLHQHGKQRFLERVTNGRRRNWHMLKWRTVGILTSTSALLLSLLLLRLWLAAAASRSPCRFLGGFFPNQRLGQLFDRGHNSRNTDIHSLDCVGQINQRWDFVLGHVFGGIGQCQLLNLVSRAGLVRQTEAPRHSIQAVPHRHINSFSANRVPLLSIVRQYLGVATGHVQDDGIGCRTTESSHFDVSHAMIHGDQRHLP